MKFKNCVQEFLFLFPLQDRKMIDALSCLCSRNSGLCFPIAICNDQLYLPALLKHVATLKKEKVLCFKLLNPSPDLLPHLYH